MESVLEVDPLTEFLSAIRNPNTRRNYEKDLSKFFDYLKIEGNLKSQAKLFCTQASKDPKWATVQINAYVLTQKERVERGEIADARVANLYKPIKLFCEENDILLNFKKIARRVPKGKRAANDRAPSVDEIKAILAYPDRRIKPAVLIMESCGCRVGSFDYLNWGHIEPIEKNKKLLAARIKIYAGTNDEYISFITPECYHAVKSYIDYRKDQGEKITKDSPVLRDLFHPDKLGKGEPHLPKRLKSTGVKRMIEDALKGTGLRVALEKGKKRHEFQADHGFRKFFNTVCDRNMRTLFVEFLMGHNTGLKENYNRAQDDELLSEYLKAVPELTILETRPAIEDMKSLEKRISELEAANKKQKEESHDNAEIVARLEVLSTSPEFHEFATWLLEKKHLAEAKDSK